MWEQHLESLLNLIIQYKKTSDQTILNEILFRIDDLICKTIHKEMYRSPHLKEVPFEDLYHTGIEYALKAISKISEKENPIKIPAWITHYVRYGIVKEFREVKKLVLESNLSEECSSLLELIEKSRERIVEDFFSAQRDRLRRLLIFDFVKECKKKKILSDEEYRSLMYFYKDELSVEKIAKLEKKSIRLIYHRLDIGLLKLKCFLEDREFKYPRRKKKYIEVVSISFSANVYFFDPSEFKVDNSKSKIENFAEKEAAKCQ